MEVMHIAPIARKKNVAPLLYRVTLNETLILGFDIINYLSHVNELCLYMVSIG